MSQQNDPDWMLQWEAMFASTETPLVFRMRSTGGVWAGTRLIFHGGDCLNAGRSGSSTLGELHSVNVLNNFL